MPADVAAQLTTVANRAFVEAIGNGFVMGAAVIMVPMLAAAFFLPNRSRQHQAEMAPSGKPQPATLGAAETAAVA